MTRNQINAIKVLALEANKSFQVKKYLSGSDIASDKDSIILLICDKFEQDELDLVGLNKLLKQLTGLK
jgi:hypothetical protein